MAALHHECASVLNGQEKYAEALAHYRESVPAFRTLRVQSMLTYSLANMAVSLREVGRYEEAERILNELAASDPQTLGGGQAMLASVHLNQSELELSRRRFPEAAAKARQAMDLLKEGGVKRDDLLAWAYGNLGMVESLGGAHARARPLCEQAVRLAAPGTDEWIIIRAHYAHALALLGAGDAQGARAAALRALEIATRLGKTEKQWRLLAVAGEASRLAGDYDTARDYFSRAASSLAQFEQSLGAEAESFRSRPDVQWLRGELGASMASAGR